MRSLMVTFAALAANHLVKKWDARGHEAHAEGMSPLARRGGKLEIAGWTRRPITVT
jgi:hypothetical protein